MKLDDGISSQHNLVKATEVLAAELTCASHPVTGFQLNLARTVSEVEPAIVVELLRQPTCLT